MVADGFPNPANVSGRPRRRAPRLRGRSRGRNALERRIIVTGGAGYLGSTLTRSLLARGHRVCVLDAQLFGGAGLSDLAGEERVTTMRLAEALQYRAHEARRFVAK